VRLLPLQNQSCQGFLSFVPRTAGLPL